MRILLTFSALTLFALTALPASAQMCGGGSQAQAAGPAAMCGGGMTAQSASPMPREGQATAKPSGCACCQNMAMMQPPASGQGSMPGMNGSGMNMPGMDMPGMDMPAQPAPDAQP